MRDYIQEHLLAIVCLWAILMTIVTLFTVVYAVTMTEVVQDLTTTVGIKDQDIQDRNDYINKIEDELILCEMDN